MKQIKQYIPTGNFVKDWENAGFIAKKVSNGAKIIEKMIRDKDCLKVIGLSGALFPAGLRGIIVEFAKNNWVDAIVTNGANLTHDLFESLGHKHYEGNEKADDKKLYNNGIDRIWNVYLKNRVYEDLEDFTQETFKKFEKRKYSTKEFLWELGKHIKDENSLLRQCYLKRIPIFCPGLADCGLGLQIWNYKRENELDIDVFKDWDEFVVNLIWPAKKTGAIILNGGMPKNFILQAQQFGEREHAYAVQITTASREDGNLSGAELKEAISWGKLSKDAEYEDIRADVTIILPIIYDYLKKSFDK